MRINLTTEEIDFLVELLVKTDLVDEKEIAFASRLIDKLSIVASSLHTESL